MNEEFKNTKKNLRFDIAYNGYNYHGWQIQNNVKTIQGEIQSQVSIIFQEQIELYGASRTDAFVHAIGQVAHCSTQSKRHAEEVQYIINKRLPNDIYVKRVSDVSSDFHARHSAKGKHYQYRIWNGKEKPLFSLNQIYWFPRERLNISLMQKAASCFIGKKDFASFASNAKRPDENTVREITEISITEDYPIIYIDVKGVSFLYKMVRGICGTLLEVGRGKEIDIYSVLESKSRCAAERNLPGQGLYLMEVYY